MQGMTTLAALGLGYCARRLIALHPDRFQRIVGTARAAEKAAAIAAPAEGLVFDGERLSSVLADALRQTDILLVSAPPDEAGDPVLRLAGEALAEGRLGQVIYLTSLGVYGDHGGAWVDETTPPRAGSPRLERRLEAEAQWIAFGRARGVPVAILRLAGIYGPGRNPLVQARGGEALRIVKPGHVFNRIHVDDVAGATLAAIDRRYDGVVNVTDDLPAASADPLAFAAGLLNLSPPATVPFEEAARAMSPMARSFWSANKRVSNARLKGELGVTLGYPTYREGLQALHAAGEGL